MTDYKTHRVPLSGNEPTSLGPTPTEEKRADGQAKDHWILSDEERSKGFIRPVRTSYQHEKCGTVTNMPLKIAETYAVNPHFYGSTFCCGCRDYFRVGSLGEFLWCDERGRVTAEKVGT